MDTQLSQEIKKSSVNNETAEQRDKKAYFEGGRDEGNKVYREV